MTGGFDVVTYALLKGKISSLESEIESLAGGIKFKGSVPTRDDLPTSPETGDAYIIEDENIQVVWDGNKWIEYGKSISYSAGNGIKIENNVISALDCKIGKKFTTNATVGNLEAGSEINAEDTLADIIYKMLYVDPYAVKVYYGATDEIPSSIDGLVSEDVDHVDLKKYIVNITAGKKTSSGTYGQCVVVAINDKYVLDSWCVADFPFGMTFNPLKIGNMNVYYLVDEHGLPIKSYDAPDGIYYQLEFVEDTNGN